MLISKIFTVITLVNVSFSGCNTQTANSKLNNAELNAFCKTFAKAICTKDTTTFYKLVDQKALNISMNEWMQGNQKITPEDLFFPFFFVYSALKIRNQDLMDARSKDIFFSSFKIVNSETMDEASTKLNVEWVQNIPEAEPQKIELYLRKSTEWKVIKVRWETL